MNSADDFMRKKRKQSVIVESPKELDDYLDDNRISNIKVAFYIILLFISVYLLLKRMAGNLYNKKMRIWFFDIAEIGWG